MQVIVECSGLHIKQSGEGTGGTKEISSAMVFTGHRSWIMLNRTSFKSPAGAAESSMMRCT